MNLLVVEDDAVLGKALLKGLSEIGHRCQWVQSGQEGLSLAASQSLDAIVLDVMLPDISGLDVLQQLRADDNHTPVLVLTALGSVDERVAGLNRGADDYLVKPFAFAELAARLDAIVRRLQKPSAMVLRAGPLVMELAARRVTRSGQEIDLTPTEFSLLEFLLRHSGQTVTRKMLCEHLWESDWEGVTNVIEVHINRLRSKIDRGFDQPMIQTVRGSGYALRLH